MANTLLHRSWQRGWVANRVNTISALEQFYGIRQLCVVDINVALGG
jgi:hypothetical protein